MGKRQHAAGYIPPCSDREAFWHHYRYPFILQGQPDGPGDRWLCKEAGPGPGDQALCGCFRGDKEKGGRILKKIEKLPELEQVEYVIDSYVNDNNIRQIEYKKNLKCKSTNDKELVFKSYMSSFSKEFIKKIYQKIFYKYNIDRKNYLIDNKKEKYKITTKDFTSKY